MPWGTFNKNDVDKRIEQALNTLELTMKIHSTLAQPPKKLLGFKLG